MEPCCRSTPAPPHLPSRSELEARSQLFKALADPSRLWLLHRLRDGEVCVCDLLVDLGLAQATLSHHLRVLLAAELVGRRRSGRWSFYQTTPLGLTFLD